MRCNIIVAIRRLMADMEWGEDYESLCYILAEFVCDGTRWNGKTWKM